MTGRDEKKRGFIGAVTSSALGTGISRLLGAARDIAVAGFLGAGAVSDAFWIAFTIPNTFRRFVADEGLTGALIPAITRTEKEAGAEGAKRLANATFTALLLINVVLCVLGMLGAEWVVRAFAYAFTADLEQFDLAVRLTRWLFPFVALVSMVSFCEGLLNYRGHYFVPKLAPGMVSAAIVVAVLLLGDLLDPPVLALVAGVLVGGLVHLVINIPPLLARWGRVVPSFAWRSPRFRSLMTELGKVALIGIFAQLNVLVLRQFAAMLGHGAVTWYWNANRLVDLAQGIVVVSIGSALLPDLSQTVAGGEWRECRKKTSAAFRLAGFLLFPAAAVIVSFTVPVTSILFRVGLYTAEDVSKTAVTLTLLVPFMLALGGINIIKKLYFALDDRKTLLVVAILGLALTAGLGWVLVERWRLAGLALALSASTVLQLLAYVVVQYRRPPEERLLALSDIALPYLKMILASVPVGVTLWLLGDLGRWERGPSDPLNLVLVLGGLCLGAIVYLIAARLLRIEVADLVSGTRLRVLGRFLKR